MHPHCNSFQTLFCRSLYLCDRQPTATVQSDPERVQWYENEERTLQCPAGLLRKLCAATAGAMRPWDASGSCNEFRPDVEDPANQIDGTGTLTWW